MALFSLLASGRSVAPLARRAASILFHWKRPKHDFVHPTQVVLLRHLEAILQHKLLYPAAPAQASRYSNSRHTAFPENKPRMCSTLAAQHKHIEQLGLPIQTALTSRHATLDCALVSPCLAFFLCSVALVLMALDFPLINSFKAKAEKKPPHQRITIVRLSTCSAGRQIFKFQPGPQCGAATRLKITVSWEWDESQGEID